MNKKRNDALRVIVFTILLFGLTHISVMNAGISTIPSAVAAAQLASPVRYSPPPYNYIMNPFWSPDWIGESDLTASSFGSSVASAGDVNGDGFDDVIVGTPHFHNGQDAEGRAYVYYGSSIGVKSLPAWTFESNIVECQVGWSVAPAGDVNGDGFDDVLAASEFCSPHPETNNREGRVYLFYGSAAGLSAAPNWMIEGAGWDESLGWSIASAGDINNDTYDDVIVGAPWASYPEGHEGRAYVFYGSDLGLPTTADWIKESNIDWTGFGQSVNSAGDVNGDGYDDVVIGSGMTNPELGEGRVYVYLGSDTGLADMPVWTFENNHAGSELGESVSPAGDINGDGYDDVVVGGFRYSNPDTREGIAYLFLGSSTGELVSSWSMESNQGYAEFGQSVSSAGDVNHDGYDDILVGAPWYSHGESCEGVVFLYYGSPTGLLSSPVHMAESNQEYANMGYSASYAGDVNGDGISDVIVGSQNFDGGQGNEGRAIVYFGRANAEHLIFVPTILR